MTIKVASLQLNAYDVGQSDLALDNALKMIDKAALDKPDLVVLPECTFPGYILGLYGDVEEQIKKTTKALELFRKKAQEYEFYLAVGLAENIKGRFLNTAVLIGPQGEIIGRAAKSFLWHFDEKWFSSGENFEVFDTKFGRVGMIVCADARQPEIPRILALKGAELIIDLTNLVTSDNQPDKLSNPQCEFMLPTRAIENRVWMIVANKVGIEADTVVYCGRSCIISPEGSIIKMASSNDQEIAFAEIDLDTSKDENNFTGHFTSFEERRPEIYKIINDNYEDLPISVYLKEGIIPEDYSSYCGLVQLNKSTLFENFIKIVSVFVERMALKNAKLLVLPDMPCLNNYINNNMLTDSLREIAIKSKIHLVTTGTFNVDGSAYKAAYLFYPDGACKHYYKAHLTDDERGTFVPGDELVVWETEIGRIGVMLGHEGFLPEVARCLTLMGADIIAWPVDFTNDYYKLFARTRASENRIYIIVANTCGSGASMVVNPFGSIQVSSFPEYEQAIGMQIEVSLARSKNVVPGSNVIKDRIPSAYKELSKY
ncbi:MAG: hypothetical protein JM58_13140 [Peptococcaceae bacterium BICA1-8]|nr:MAG: hypothetical protein JM58_13140 [Peptococcaceae bacterium BICA1-8]